MRALASRLFLGLFQPSDKGFLIVASILMVVEAVLSTFVIQRVPYTEIDWSTYMQQVECYVKKGIMNYTKIGGDTGPVVYPAGHIWVYRILYSLTDSGKSIRTAQHIFQAFYLLNLFFVFRILFKTHKLPPIILFLVSVTGYRIHSIFMLRLFNDPLAMLLFYVALDQLLDDKWLLGCVLYSFAVSIKMNVLLFAPALFFTLLLNTGFLHTLGYIAVCGAIQVYVGGPFLLFDWKSYVTRSFDLGRVFMFKWTVNWRFLPEEFFLDKRFHIALLVGHLTVLAVFAWFMWFRRLNGLPSSVSLLFRGITSATGPVDTLYAFFTSNLIGIVFSRSLHYQFYSWYFHQLPFLLFANYPYISSISEIPWKQFFWKVPLLLAVELSWNVYPSTWWSSLLLHVCHVIILYHLIVSRPKKPIDSVTPYTLDLVKKRIENLQKEFEMYGSVVPREKEAEPKFEEDSSDEELDDKDDKGRKVFRPKTRTLPNGKKIPAIYRDEEEMDEAFEDYWEEQLDNLRNTHQVYFGRDGQREVTGLPPIGDGSKLKFHEKVKLLYADTLYLRKQLEEEAEEERRQQNGHSNGNSVHFPAPDAPDVDLPDSEDDPEEDVPEDVPEDKKDDGVRRRAVPERID